MLQYGPILAVLNTTKTNTRIRIFHTRVKLRYTPVASYSILTTQLLVVCLTLVRWPKTVTAKALTSQQKEKHHGKKNNFTVRQKEKDSRQEEKPHGKKQKTKSKKKTSQQKENDSWQNFFDTERTF